MSGRASKSVRDEIWRNMIARAETLHDATVMSQRRASKTAIARIHTLSADIVSLARVAQIILHEEQR